MILRGALRFACTMAFLSVVSAPAAASPLRATLALQAGAVVAGTQLGIGDAALTDGAGLEWTGRLTCSIAARDPAGLDWRTGVAYQQWSIRDDLEIRYLATGGSLTPMALRYTLTQTVQELVVPLQVRLTRSEASGWFLDLGADVALRLGVQQRLEAGDPVPVSSAPRTAAPLAAQADIFEEVGTFDGDTGVAGRFVPVAVGASAGVGYAWTAARPRHVSITLQQALHDQERASVAVVRPTRLAIEVGVGL